VRHMRVKKCSAVCMHCEACSREENNASSRPVRLEDQVRIWHGVAEHALAIPSCGVAFIRSRRRPHETQHRYVALGNKILQPLLFSVGDSAHIIRLSDPAGRCICTPPGYRDPVSVLQKCAMLCRYRAVTNETQMRAKIHSLKKCWVCGKVCGTERLLCR